MKTRDILRLITNEAKYGKREWVLSYMMQTLLMVCVLICMVFFTRLPKTGDILLHAAFDSEEFGFQLSGYTRSDLDELTKMGFEDINFDMREPVGYLKNLEHIWWYKFRAVIQGNDIWNQEIDGYLMILLFCRIVFAVIGILLWVILLNSVSNSFRIKLKERERFVQMMYRLGCTKRTIFFLYYAFFALRALLVFFTAVVLSGITMHLLNGYMENVMYLKVDMPIIPGVLIAVMVLLQLMLMRRTMRKAWRESNEED